MEIPTFNEAAKMFDIVDTYLNNVRLEGWTWKDAVNFIQEHWQDEEYNIDYLNNLDLE